MNALKKRIVEILGGRTDFDDLEIDPKLLLSEVPPKDTSDDIVSGNLITAEGVKAWLKTLPEPTFEELQDRLWRDHK